MSSQISYELAKSLRDAGFPQRTKWAYAVILEEGTIQNCHIFPTQYEKGSDYAMVKGDIFEEEVAAPTLEELIEAFGNEFRNLEQYSNTEDSKLVYLWQANAFRERASSRKYVAFYKARGPTPTEAVANLWLALNTK